jgi:hypothetical protein
MKKLLAALLLLLPAVLLAQPSMSPYSQGALPKTNYLRWHEYLRISNFVSTNILNQTNGLGVLNAVGVSNFVATNILNQSNAGGVINNLFTTSWLNANKATNVVWLSTKTNGSGTGTFDNPIPVGTALLFDTYFSNSAANTTYRFFPGTYYTIGHSDLITNTPYLKSGQTWEGSGMDNTRIVLTNVPVAPGWMNSVQAADGIHVLGDANFARKYTNITIRDLTIDGNSDGNGSASVTNRAIHGIILAGSDCLFERIKITGARGNYALRESFPFFLEGEGNTVRDSFGVMTTRYPLDYVSVFTMNVTGDAFTNDSFKPNRFYNCFVDFTSPSNGNTGFTLTRGVVIDSCTVQNCRSGYYNDSLPANNMALINSHAINIMSGIKNDTSGTGNITNVLIANNRILLNGSLTFSNPYSSRLDNSGTLGILISAPASHPTYTGRSVGIQILNNFIDWVANSNSVANAEAASISFNGISNAVIAGNVSVGTAYAPLAISGAALLNMSNSQPGQITYFNNIDLRTGRVLGYAQGAVDQRRFEGNTNVGSVLLVGTNFQIYAGSNVSSATNVFVHAGSGVTVVTNTVGSVYTVSASGGGSAISNFVSGSFTNFLSLQYTAVSNDQAVHLGLLSAASNALQGFITAASNNVVNISNKLDGVSNIVVATSNLLSAYIPTNAGTGYNTTFTNTGPTAKPVTISAVANTVTNLIEVQTNGVRVFEVMSNGNFTSSGGATIGGDVTVNGNDVFGGAGYWRISSDSTYGTSIGQSAPLRLARDGYTGAGTNVFSLRWTAHSAGAAALADSNLVVSGWVTPTNGLVYPLTTNSAVASTNFHINLTNGANVVVRLPTALASTIWLTNIVSGKNTELTVIGEFGSSYQIKITNSATQYDLLWPGATHPPVTTNTDIYVLKAIGTNIYGAAQTNYPNR